MKFHEIVTKEQSVKHKSHKSRRTQNGFGQMRTISSQMHLMKGDHQRKHFPEKPGEVVPKGEGGENTGRNHRTET